jgi:hypothetical protein
MCSKGIHNLIEIYNASSRYDNSSVVVRWCQDCGAVVVDEDYDGRTNAGSIMKMRLPKINER